MKKLVFFIIIVLDFLFLLIFINNDLLELLFIYLLLNIIFFIIFLKLYFNVRVININKYKNVFKTIKIRKNILPDEIYMKKLKINTFDGSGGTTHPCIISIDNHPKNYKYYMVHTPYDNHNTELENPSLCVSIDGETFFKLKNTKDPLLPISKRYKGEIARYYNDNFLLYEDKKLQIWYRYTEEDKITNSHKIVNRIYRIITMDGEKFTDPELMIDYDDIWYLSPSLVNINNLYHLYYFDKDFKLHCKTSIDLYNWSEAKNVIINGYNNNIWHGEVKVVNNKLYLLFLSKDYNLYFCESDIDTPFNFKTCKKLNLSYYEKTMLYGNEKPYKSTFLIDDKYIHLYIPYQVSAINFKKLKRHIKWTMTYTRLRKENFKIILEDKC